VGKGQRSEIRDLKIRYRWDIIEAVEWTKELVWQNVKNVIKKAMLAYWNKR